MDKKTGGLIATIGTTLVCACPGLCLCLWDGLGLSGTPIDTNVNGQTSSQPMNTGLAIGLLCVSVVAIATPAVVGFFTLRNTDEDNVVSAVPSAPSYSDDDIIPPAS